MKKLAVVTATRAEYGLLKPVIRALRQDEGPTLQIELIVTGTHLSERYGKTIQEIDSDGIRIDRKIPISVCSEAELDISRNQAEALIRFTDVFCEQRYDAVMLLGDRYETLAIAIAAGNTRTPIFHLCGGDTTEGAIDEWIRHTITKISYLHFVTNEQSRKRVIQLGEDPQRVFNFGSTSIDNTLQAADMTKAEALESIGLSECTYALGTYHPVTMAQEDIDWMMNQFLNAIKAFPEMNFIVTKSNADQGGSKINEILDKAEKEINNLHVYASLGVRRYLSLMKHAELVLGNSSSGIIETPAFHIPTVNIGDRQRGRLQARSILNCGEQAEEIIATIRKALTPAYREICKSVVSPYGDGKSAGRIAAQSVKTLMNGSIDLKKKFFDYEQVK